MKNRNLAKTIFPVLMLSVSVFGFTGCKQKLNDTPLENMATIADFTEGETEAFFPSHGWSNGGPFNVTWSKKNVAYENGVAKLSITEDEDGTFYGGELRSKDHYHYGDYEITMKPEAKKGTCTSFFVYTGPTEFDAEGNPNPHDEIDIEFLGKDTTHVQFNFFVNGVGGNEFKYDLGFDASEEFHTYGFRWTEDYITWYVDGEPVYRVDETEKKPIPHTAGRMMTNYWCGSEVAEAWMGKYDHPGEGEASEYKLIKTSATPIVAEEAPGVDSNIDWSAIAPVSGLNTISSDGKHTVTAEGSAYTVAYENVVGASYNNVKFELAGAAEGMNYLALNITNNVAGTFPTVRVDVFGDATRKTVNNKNVCNVSSTLNGAEVYTDLDWGGTTYAELESGKTHEVIIYFEGRATDLQIMFDSCNYMDSGKNVLYSGNVTISDIKFGVHGDLVLPEVTEPENPGEGTEEPEIPVPGTIAINGVEKAFEGNVDPYVAPFYFLAYNENAVAISYKDMPGNSYKNINTYVGDIANTRDTVSITDRKSVV